MPPERCDYCQVPLDECKRKGVRIYGHARSFKVCKVASECYKKAQDELRADRKRSQGL